MINETVHYEFSRLSSALLRIINKIEKPKLVISERVVEKPFVYS